MSRTLIPLQVSDTSTFAKALRAQLVAHQGLPSHLQMLNMVAKAAGHGNMQALRARAELNSAIIRVDEEDIISKRPEAVDEKHIERVVRCFDDSRRLLRWPSRRSDQILVLWILWSQMPASVAMSERDVSGLLQEKHLFGDHALLRRELYELGLVTRTRDGSVYRRVEQPVAMNLASALRRLASR
ncbi:MULTISPECIES: DUF2087 domain-containing protein [Rhizobium]|uniref:DUF2087 domain-containing protein n=1 Tax=Rhizobium laguerreae TaxID=1076926 RepID=A0AB35FFQ6_9HYPH|nr:MULTISPECIES: DUF2087 domain-containing protein [Rhizobium]MBY3064630.1 DUF2087 domain-containing protein [Rhizobium laguerreae]MBY3134432.1 DUF2087 domain-containing protein [Rhizobium laguerreae]MBY3157451.1 DUF2087 domain-containing protein [Rhizobium laguerreae]MBY3169999.1 DUF2087 domain-containing protein [Rhizobium laguerreae]MBY3445965.1 DUF2087 domain-containing protein [Rhizobium laguerreae]